MNKSELMYLRKDLVVDINTSLGLVWHQEGILDIAVNKIQQLKTWQEPPLF